jgi:hypothetical protein
MDCPEKETMIRQKKNFRGIRKQSRNARARQCLMTLYLKSLIILTGILSEVANAECISLVKGPVIVDIQSCGAVNPDAFDVKREKYKFIGDLDPPGRKMLLNQYRGLYLKGVVVRSTAIREGIDTTPGALQGDSVQLFIPPGQAQCTAVQNKRVAGILQEKCCDGNGDAPCLLNTGLIFTKPKAVGQAGVGLDGKLLSPTKNNREHKKNYLDAQKYFVKKDYKKATALFKKADEEKDIDVKGLYQWGSAYRELEDCPAAIAPLERIYKLNQNGKVWKDEELDARRAVFLLARCHSKMNQPSQSAFYLNGFLVEPKRYMTEIKQSLKHKDFGWIHTSKEYVEYKAEAERVIAEMK